MAAVLLVFVLIVQTCWAERAGYTDCSSETYPASAVSGNINPDSTSGDRTVLVQHEDYMFHCCGVVKQWKVDSAGGDVFFQIWRQTAADSYTLVSQSDTTTVASGSVTIDVDDDKKVSFREGDYIGWRSPAGGDLFKGASSSDVNFNRYATTGAQNVGDTHDWNAATGFLSSRQYAIQAVTAMSTAPYFINLPTTLQYTDVEMKTSGKTLMTLLVNDLDPADVNIGLTVSMDPGWTDFFSLDTSTRILKTSRKLEPGSYNPVFRVEEAHCGVTSTAVLTVTVTESPPTITNLPHAATVHEDDLDETLLYTILTSDPMDQPIWCKGDWTIGVPSAGNTPFIVKMLNTTAGDSRAGIYLIEWPELDYTTKSFYDLTIECMDTASQTVTGKFYVSVVENQPPYFTNLGNMVQIDARTAIRGDVLFTVSSTDVENDQVTYTYTCTPSVTTDGACPFKVYKAGQVVLQNNLYLWTTDTYTLTITASDHRADNVPTSSRDLIIYISNLNSDPVFTNVNAVSLSVAENSDLALFVYQLSATDSDTTDNLTFFMTIQEEEGWGLFQMTPEGLVSTHSLYNINFEDLTAAGQQYHLVMYVHDGRKYVTDTLTVTITDTNEAVKFTQTGYAVSIPETTAGGTTADTTILAIDPDAADTSLTYTMNCGSYDAYFSLTLVGTTLRVTVLQAYDLDTGLLPQQVECSLLVEDSVKNNDTSTLYINFEYVNDNAPVFSPDTYTVALGSNTALGTSVLQTTATDADAGDHGVLTYTLDSSATSATYFSVKFGVIYTKTVLSALTSGTHTMTVTATDGGGRTDTATVTMTFSEVVGATVITTDRNKGFIEDGRNITWLTIACVTVVVCVFVIVVIIIRYCMARKESIFAPCLRWIRPDPKLLERHRRNKRYGKQQEPLYKHLHARDLLKYEPPPTATPAPVDEIASNRPNSTFSNVTGRVTVTDVHVHGQPSSRADSTDNVNAWMDAYSTSPTSVPPHLTVTEPDPASHVYLNRRERRKNRSTPEVEGLFSPDKLPPSPSIALSGDRLHDRTPIVVTPTRQQWDNTANGNPLRDDDDDDFRSDRLSVLDDDDSI